MTDLKGTSVLEGHPSYWKKSTLILFHQLKASFLLNGTSRKCLSEKPISTTGTRWGQAGRNLQMDDVRTCEKDAWTNIC